MQFDEILRSHRDDLALLIGNGIDQFHGATHHSWDQLLSALAKEHGLSFDKVPEGASATEFFDVLELKAKAGSGELGKEFCGLMADWRPGEHHRQIMHWARRNEVPVLTTNFDRVLSKAIDARLMRPKVRGFTDFYPWDSRFADTLYDDPGVGFGIWHVNGMARYARSVALGLTQYMGSVQRARGWFHRSDSRLFAKKSTPNWPGAGTWLQLIFNKPLLIFGLGLGENEVFLRWLLIERAKYFAEFPDRRHDAWYAVDWRQDRCRPTILPRRRRHHLRRRHAVRGYLRKSGLDGIGRALTFDPYRKCSGGAV